MTRKQLIGKKVIFSEEYPSENRGTPKIIYPVKSIRKIKNIEGKPVNLLSLSFNIGVEMTNKQLLQFRKTGNIKIENMRNYMYTNLELIHE